MPKPDSLQGSLDLLILKILSRRPRLHGYALMTAIRESSGDVLRAEAGFVPNGLPKTPAGARVNTI
jgi:DNA-binding PadR family transcriptional regulator